MISLVSFGHSNIPRRMVVENTNANSHFNWDSVHDEYVRKYIDDFPREVANSITFLMLYNCE